MHSITCEYSTALRKRLCYSGTAVCARCAWSACVLLSHACVCPLQVVVVAVAVVVLVAVVLLVVVQVCPKDPVALW